MKTKILILINKIDDKEDDKEDDKKDDIDRLKTKIENKETDIENKEDDKKVDIDGLQRIEIRSRRLLAIVTTWKISNLDSPILLVTNIIGPIII